MGEDKLSAAKVARLLFENIVRFFGVPKEFVHDRDPRFTSTLWRELWKILGTKTSASTAFHPQTDGQSERTNRTFEQILRAHIHDKPPNAWLDALPYTEFAINNTISQSTGYSPFFLLYGQPIPSPLDHALAQPNPQSTTAPKIAQTMQKFIQHAKTNMKRA